MAKFTVIGIVDGDTFDVSPQWLWNDQTGSRIRPAGYDAPELNTLAGQIAKGKLSRLIAGKLVELGSAYRIDRGRLVCDVLFNGKKLEEYFSSYQ